MVFAAYPVSLGGPVKATRAINFMPCGGNFDAYLWAFRYMWRLLRMLFKRFDTYLWHSRMIGHLFGGVQKLLWVSEERSGKQV